MSSLVDLDDRVVELAERLGSIVHMEREAIFEIALWNLARKFGVKVIPDPEENPNA
jgi:hypothetical protein